jgi:hypothetical protein
MARKNYTAEQIIGMLREPEVCLLQGEKTGRSAGVWGYRSRATTAGGCFELLNAKPFGGYFFTSEKTLGSLS